MIVSVCLGPCYKVHDEQLRRSYVESDMKGKLGYEADFLAYLERIIRDLDRKINRGQDRLRKSAEAKQQVTIILATPLVATAAKTVLINAPLLSFFYCRKCEE